MCLVLIGWRAHPDYRLIVAANRDEYYTRPTAPMRWWDEVPGLLAGRDLGNGTGMPGTWLGLLPAASRFATVTNVRGPAENRTGVRSRGALLLDFLRDTADPEKFVRSVAAAPDNYNGYNLVGSDLESLWWHSNRSTLTPAELRPGLHGLSNGALLGSGDIHSDTVIRTDTGAPAWPKVRDGLAALREVIRTEPADVPAYFDLLADRTIAPDDQLPSTGLSRRRERAVSARFVADATHGTRCSTVLLVREDGTFEIAERSFGRLGRRRGEVSFSGTVRLPA
ncbi:NRDE family protein [Nocardia sp. CDC159]|uniref:NRDE family protein n=1 Tax=Nocardia pulmonis TaxID=2951408 RepID=A0A9X2EDZ7_9NOCA|nr:MULTISPECIES: NRDE family protein [Nocardia]MCM6777288.1 NRDE family protein [Nocardia pulmonis]MCM6790173.1 NRDE family protein [Nocardia sp. CDC159]